MGTFLCSFSSKRRYLPIVSVELETHREGHLLPAFCVVETIWSQLLYHMR